MTRFHIKETFRLTSRDATIFLGEIICRTINIGQIIQLKETEDRRGLRLRISAINYLDNVSERLTQIGLTVTPLIQEDLEELKGIKIKDEEVEIIDKSDGHRA